MNVIPAFDSAETLDINTGETTIFLRRLGSGPPLLLLHGFPQTHLMWRAIAPWLADRFTVICADLRGYGQSGCPPSDADSTPYTKRAMARDMVAVMDQLGFDQFALAGHDRGGRVAYRLALDYPQQVERLAVLDVVPTSEVWARADKQLALAYWPWSLLAQPYPLPEELIRAAPGAIIDDALSNWGTPRIVFDPSIQEAYRRPFRDATRVHAICEDYRAAATLDQAHDQTDRSANRRIKCPLLLLWAKGNALDTWYTQEGGPLQIWQAWAEDVRGWAVAGGHFFPEAAPQQTAQAFLEFFSKSL